MSQSPIPIVLNIPQMEDELGQMLDFILGYEIEGVTRETQHIQEPTRFVFRDTSRGRGFYAVWQFYYIIAAEAA